MRGAGILIAVVAFIAGVAGPGRGATGDHSGEMCNWGALEMRDLRLKWTGSSNIHGETCAVVLFQSFSNPVDASPIRGRSCYWGQIWVSLDDWEIECRTLNEDVMLEIPVGDAGSQVMNIQREVKFEKTS